MLAVLLSAGSKALAVPATDLKENYQSIIDRNPFGLKPPPPPPTNNPAANAAKDKPKTELFLTGIVSIGYPKMPKQAFLMTKEQNKKEPTYYTLTEGVEKDGIKVLSIDDAGRKVRVQTDEGEILLSFQTHGVPPPAAAVTKPGQPGQPGAPGQPGPGQLGVVPLPGAPGNPQAAAPTPVTPIATPAPNNSSVPSNTRSIPSRRVRAGMDTGMMNGGGGLPVPGAPSGGAVQPEMDPAEQYIRMHLNRTAAEKQGISQPPLPIIGQ